MGDREGTQEAQARTLVALRSQRQRTPAQLSGLTFELLREELNAGRLGGGVTLDDLTFERLSADVIARPNDLQARRARATWLARRGHWGEAADDQIRSFAQPVSWFSDTGITLAALRLVSGHSDQYRAMLKVLRELPPSPAVKTGEVYLVRIGILAPQP